MPKTTEIVALAFLVLFAALFIPVTLNATTTDKTSGYQVEETDVIQPTESFSVVIDDIRTSPDPSRVDITVRDEQSMERISQTINATEDATYGLAGGDVTVTVDSISNETVATIMVQYPRTYGWSEPAQAFGNHLHIILAIVALVMVAGAIGRVI